MYEVGQKAQERHAIDMFMVQIQPYMLGQHEDMHTHPCTHPYAHTPTCTHPCTHSPVRQPHPPVPCTHTPRVHGVGLTGLEVDLEVLLRAWVKGREWLGGPQAFPPQQEGMASPLPEEVGGEGPGEEPSVTLVSERCWSWPSPPQELWIWALFQVCVHHEMQAPPPGRVAEAEALRPAGSLFPPKVRASSVL